MSRHAAGLRSRLDRLGTVRRAKGRNHAPVPREPSHQAEAVPDAAASPYGDALPQVGAMADDGTVVTENPVAAEGVAVAGNVMADKDAMTDDGTVVRAEPVTDDRTVMRDDTNTAHREGAATSGDAAPPDGHAPPDADDIAFAASQSLPAPEVAWAAEAIARLEANVARVVLGKAHPVRLCVAAMLAGGHVLVEDSPGTGKTRLARALAESLDVTCSRIQGTPDLLPGDVTGGLTLGPERGTLVFRRGPVFVSVVLVDEVNRASPKAQSALLEVMEEHTVTVDGVPHAVPEPFLVIATQNPQDQAGTYPLPDAQLDRFLLRVKLGHPGHTVAVRLVAEDRGIHPVQASQPAASAGPVAAGGPATSDGPANSPHTPVLGSRRRSPGELAPVLSAADMARLRSMAGDVHLDGSIAEYIVRLVEATRRDGQAAAGVSTRGALALARCAKAWALAQGRGYVVPDDVRALAVPVLAHRLRLVPEAAWEGATVEGIVERIVEQTPAPTGGDA